MLSRIRISVLLALAIGLGACSSDSGPSIASLDEMRVIKVSGDQSSPVPSAPSQTIYATAGASLQVSPGTSYTPEPLVARVEVQGQSRGVAGGGLVIPTGTLVHWDLPEGAGKLRGLTTATDDTAHIINRWAPGTVAGTYQAAAIRILGDGSMVTDASWELVVEPGAVASIYPIQSRTDLPVMPGDVIDARDLIHSGRDGHGNAVDPDHVRATVPDSLIRWQWIDRANQMARQPVRSGWLVTAPDFATDGFHVSYTGDRYAPGLYIWHAHAPHASGEQIMFTSPLDPGQ